MSEKTKQKLKEKSSFVTRGISRDAILKRAKSNTGKKRTEKQKENLKEGQKREFVLREDYKALKCINIKTGLVDGIFLTPTDVAAFLNTSNTPNIVACLKNRIKSTKGYKIEYADEYETKTLLLKEGYLENKLFKDYEDILYTKKQLLSMSVKEREELVEYVYNNLNGFIFPEPAEISLSEIINIIKDADRCYNPKTKTFSNSFQLSSGTTLLKSYFKSFFKSANKGDKSVYQKINEKEGLRNVIKYRIGLNSTGEIWDLKFKTIVRGYSAIRGLVSFFKPAVALSIYRNLGNTPNVVLDPCCGFGGRMLGYFLCNPKGTYIGCEPNKETFEELLLLKSALEKYFKFELKCHLYNITLEECFESKYGQDKRQIDYVFTSIPYYDLETYSEDVVSLKYKDFEDWKNKFIGTLLKMDNVWLNMPIELKNKLNLKGEEYFLENNVSKHINKSQDKKKEIIIGLNLNLKIGDRLYQIETLKKEVERFNNTKVGELRHL